jgi:spermidine/putrescine transport system substrate-binding protein
MTYRLASNTISYRRLILGLCFLLAISLSSNSFSDTTYAVKKGDFLGKIVSKNYPSKDRITSKQQIMVAILRANPDAFRGGNIHFLKRVDQLVLPSESSIVLIANKNAEKTIKKHYVFFKKRKTGNFPPIPLQRPTTEKLPQKTTVSNKAEMEKKPVRVQKETVKISEAENKKSISKEASTDSKESISPLMERDNTSSNETSDPNEKGSAATGALIEKVQEDENKTTADVSKGSAVTDNNGAPLKDVSSSPDRVMSEAGEGVHSALLGKNKIRDTHEIDDVIPAIKEGANEKTKTAEVNQTKKIMARRSENEKKEITVYNWNNFLPEDVLTRFTEETGIRVNYFTYSNNKILYEKVKALKGRGYDVLFSSAGIVQKLRDHGLIQAIDHRKLSNLKNIALIETTYDPKNQFSIPYLWGSTGLAINTEQVGDAEVTHWKDLWHKRWKGKLLLRDNMRDLFSIALKVNGHSLNSRNPDEIKQAYKALRRLIPNIKKLTNESEVRSEFSKKTASVGTLAGSSASKIKQKNSAFQYLYPKEGAIFWVESLVIPANPSDIESAYIFIDYLLRPEIAARCVTILAKATPNLASRALLDEAVRGDSSIFPNKEVFEKGEFQEDVGEIEALYQLYWRKFNYEIEVR